MTDAPLVAGQAYGLRTWRVASRDGRESLTGPHQGASWPAGRAWLEATCSEPGAHPAPAPGCGCGVHAWHPSRAAARRVLSPRWLVPGVVEGRGALEVHREGFRAQEARPHVLFVAPRRNRRQIARLAAAYGAEVVSVRGPDDVAAYCRERGLGFAPAVVADLLGPQEARREALAERKRRRSGALRLVAIVVCSAGLCAAGLSLSSREPSGKVLTGRAGQIRTP